MVDVSGGGASRAEGDPELSGAPGSPAAALELPSKLLLIANARLPSQRAQSLQVAQVAGAFARAGAPTLLLHARRVPTPALPPGQDLFDYYALAPGPRPEVQAVPCRDWIDRGPRRLQFASARLQEWSFARAAAGAALGHPGAWVLSRELECARYLALGRGPGRGFRGRVYLELHRLPGGRLRRRWLLETLPRLSGVVAISGGVAEDLLALGLERERLCVEHDGFEPGRFASLPDRGRARAELGVAQDAPLVVYTGSLLDWKGVDLLVAAARALPAARFLVAGGPADAAAALVERARGVENLRVDGFQPPGRVALYLAAADLGVVPNRSRPAISARYTSPLKVFEAMAAGLPLVASDLPALRDVLTDGEDALLVAPDDPAALAAGIARLLGDAGLRARLAARLRRRAPAYGWDARAARLLRWMGQGPEVGAL